MMVMMMLVLVFVFDLCRSRCHQFERQVLRSLHDFKDTLAGQCVPRSGQDTRFRILFTEHIHAGLQFLVVYVLRT